jgi:hypothetical protein
MPARCASRLKPDFVNTPIPVVRIAIDRRLADDWRAADAPENARRAKSENLSTAEAPGRRHIDVRGIELGNRAAAKQL